MATPITVDPRRAFGEVDLGGVESIGIELVRALDPEPLEHGAVLLIGRPGA